MTNRNASSLPTPAGAVAAPRHGRRNLVIGACAALALVAAGGSGAYAVTTANLRADLADANAHTVKAAASAAGVDQELAAAVADAQTTAAQWDAATIQQLGAVVGADAANRLSAAVAALATHDVAAPAAAPIDVRAYTAGDWDLPGLQAAVAEARAQADRVDARTAAPRAALETVRGNAKAMTDAAAAVTASLQHVQQQILDANPQAAAEIRAAFEAAGRDMAASFTPAGVAGLVDAYARLGRSQADAVAAASGGSGGSAWGGGGGGASGGSGSGGGGWGGGGANGGGGGWGQWGGGWGR